MNFHPNGATSVRSVSLMLKRKFVLSTEQISKGITFRRGPSRTGCGLLQCSKTAFLFDHLVGTSQQCRWHGQPPRRLANAVRMAEPPALQIIQAG